MTHGSTHLQARKSPGLRYDWLAALHRGTILGLVLALHLGLLVLLLGPVTPRWPTSSTHSEHDDALHIRVVAEAVKPRPANPMQKPPTQTRQILRKAPVVTATPNAAMKPAVTAMVVESAGVAGDYHSPVLAGRAGMGLSPSMPHLPGADTPRIRGITLDARPSLRQVVRAMTTASRCKYTRMKMERSTNQFVTRQLMERALEADGCGPQAPDTAADDTVEAISHQAIFGN